jgi:hypothetical protein
MPPLSALPNPTPGTAWDPHIHRSFEILKDISTHTIQTLQSPGNMHRLQFYTQLIANDAVPLLCALEAEGQNVDNNLIMWAQEAAHHFRQLMDDLNNAAQSEETR